MGFSFIDKEILMTTFISIWLTIFGLGLGFALLRLQTGLSLNF